jgi:hypothetical protein
LVRWVSGSGTHESFCLALWGFLGLWCLWFRAGVPWSVPDPGIRFSVELGHRPCSLPMRLEGLAGGSCLSPPWRAAGSVKNPASLPQICQVKGISQVSFPYQGRYSPATRPVTLEDDGDDGAKTGCLLIGAVQDQAQFGCFV